MVSDVFQGLFDIGPQILVLRVQKIHQIYNYLIISLEYALLLALEIHRAKHDQQRSVVRLVVDV